MPFRPVFIAIVIAFARILGAFLIQRARPRVELDQPNANFVRATGVLHAKVAFHALTKSNSFLGKGGMRLLLDYPQLARTQVKSLLRLSQAQDIRILVPWLPLNVTCNRYANCSYRSLTKWGSSRVLRLISLSSATRRTFVIDLMDVGRSEIHQRLMGSMVMIVLDIPADRFFGRCLQYSIT
jgi:PEP-utilising enzyme, PEP-binding domain